jgi:hypothetical protein
MKYHGPPCQGGPGNRSKRQSSKARRYTRFPGPVATPSKPVRIDYRLPVVSPLEFVELHEIFGRVVPAVDLTAAFAGYRGAVLHVRGTAS